MKLFEKKRKHIKKNVQSHIDIKWAYLIRVSNTHLVKVKKSQTRQIHCFPCTNCSGYFPTELGTQLSTILATAVLGIMVGCEIFIFYTHISKVTCKEAYHVFLKPFTFSSIWPWDQKKNLQGAQFLSKYHLFIREIWSKNETQIKSDFVRVLWPGLEQYALDSATTSVMSIKISLSLIKFEKY